MENPANTAPKEPLFNVPPLTLALTVLIVIAHIVRLLLPPELKDSWLIHMVFVPHAFPEHQIWTVLTYAFVHAGWLHCLLNALSLLAFGAAIERMKGKVWLCILLIGGTFFGAIAHWLLFPESLVPLAGISAGISAVLAMLLCLVSHNWSGLVFAVLAFLVTNILIGMIGIPNEPSLSVAWQAHIGGFAFGLVLGLIEKFRRPAV